MRITKTKCISFHPGWGGHIFHNPDRRPEPGAVQSGDSHRVGLFGEMGQEEEEEEGREIEGQLELQLQEQRDSLSAVEQALASDPSNSDLLEVSLFPSRQLFIHLTTQYFRLHRRERERERKRNLCAI